MLSGFPSSFNVHGSPRSPNRTESVLVTGVFRNLFNVIPRSRNVVANVRNEEMSVRDVRDENQKRASTVCLETSEVIHIYEGGRTQNHQRSQLMVSLVSGSCFSGLPTRDSAVDECAVDLFIIQSPRRRPD